MQTQTYRYKVRNSGYANDLIEPHPRESGGLNRFSLVPFFRAWESKGCRDRSK